MEILFCSDAMHEISDVLFFYRVMYIRICHEVEHQSWNKFLNLANITPSSIAVVDWKFDRGDSHSSKQLMVK